jgi:MoaA/NifB/PqqE/SkfB family radical SAM enzyme
MTPKDVFTNPYFCPMPWTGLMYNFDGTVKNCIRSAGPLGDIKQQSIQDILIKNNLERQQNIISNSPVETCNTCYDLEHGQKSFNIISDRIFYIKEFKKTPLSTYKPGNFQLTTVDIRWSNLCNFACVYCGPEFSSKWAQEIKQTLPTPTDEQVQQFKQYIFDNAATLKHVYLAGGEPLLIKENLELLERLSPDVNLRINTNLSKVNTSIFEKICSFKNVHWTISIDTIEQEFEYIRYGSKWSDFLENLDVVKQLDHKITFNMLHFLLNYFSIFDCVEFLKKYGFHNNSFVIGGLIAPQWLNINNLPGHLIDQIKTRLTDKLSQNPGYLLENSYKNMLHFMQQPFCKNLDKSLTQLAIMDQRRNLDSKSIFTNFYKDIQHGKTI